MNLTTPKHLLFAGLLSLGCLAGCSDSNTGTFVIPDLASPADLVTQDLTTPPDLTTPNVFNNCTPADFADRSAATSMRTVAFPGANNSYTPKCMKIAKGQMVTFQTAAPSNFSLHPLRPGVGANATAGMLGAAGNPIKLTNGAAMVSISFTFAEAGYYPYNCSVHDGLGMNGVIQVF